MGVSGQLHALLLYPRKTTDDDHNVEGCVGPRADLNHLDALEKNGRSCPCMDAIPDYAVVPSPQPSRHTD
jgi:hypothetical protein